MILGWFTRGSGGGQAPSDPPVSSAQWVRPMMATRDTAAPARVRPIRVRPGRNGEEDD